MSKIHIVAEDVTGSQGFLPLLGKLSHEALRIHCTDKQMDELFEYFDRGTFLADMVMEHLLDEHCEEVWDD